VSALRDALDDVCARCAGELESLGTWTWVANGETIARAELGDGPALIFEGSAETLHQLLSGRASELEELLRGNLVLQGDATLAIALLRLLPQLGAHYSATVGIEDFEHQQIMILRSLRRVHVDESAGFPEALSISPADQAFLVALILGGLPTACRVVQTAHLAHAFASEPVVASRLVLLLSEFADLVAQRSNRQTKTPLAAY